MNQVSTFPDISTFLFDSLVVTCARRCIMATRFGQIVGFCGSMGSGLATLAIAVEPQGYIAHIPCDAGPASRALRSAFGDRVIGQEISFVVDELGILSSFSPAEEVRE